MAFFVILRQFGGPKIIQKSLIFEKIEVRRRPLKHWCFRVAFCMAFEALGARFSLIFEPPEAIFAFPQGHRSMRNLRGALHVAGLTLMIRATSSRSIDR